MANQLSIEENKHQIHPKVHTSEYLGKDKPSDFNGRSVQISPKTEQRIDSFLKKHRLGYFRRISQHYQEMSRRKKMDKQVFIESLSEESGGLSYRPNN